MTTQEMGYNSGMRYWVPELRLTMFCPPETAFVERFGGLPWGLPVNKVPVCPDCKKPYTLLVQLEHSERLDLGRRGRRLYTFQCGSWPNDCPSVLDNGCAIILEPEEIENARPLPVAPRDKWFVPVQITAWNSHEELVTPEIQQKLLANEMSLFDLDVNIQSSIGTRTKIGGTPFWGQPGPPFKKDEGWKLLLQMDDCVTAIGPIPRADDLGCRIVDETRPRTPSETPPNEYPTVETSASHWALILERNGNRSRCAISVGNFGQGHAYVFARRLETKRPELMFLWQR